MARAPLASLDCQFAVLKRGGLRRALQDRATVPRASGANQKSGSCTSRDCTPSRPAPRSERRALPPLRGVGNAQVEARSSHRSRRIDGQTLLGSHSTRKQRPRGRLIPASGLAAFASRLARSRDAPHTTLETSRGGARDEPHASGEKPHDVLFAAWRRSLFPTCADTVGPSPCLPASNDAWTRGCFPKLQGTRLLSCRGRGARIRTWTDAGSEPAAMPFRYASVSREGIEPVAVGVRTRCSTFELPTRCSCLMPRFVSFHPGGKPGFGWRPTESNRFAQRRPGYSRPSGPPDYSNAENRKAASGLPGGFVLRLLRRGRRLPGYSRPSLIWFR